MQIVHEIQALRSVLKKEGKTGKRTGFIPTMGCLHHGHISLVHQARQENDIVVMSIFVNPLQFGAGEDYEDYPRDLTGDAAFAEKNGCDFLFAPSVREMYPRNYATFVDVERLTTGLCGASRFGHFRGVTTVVAKLFNIVAPENAYFGQKDAQQALVLQRMAKDLNMDLSVIILPTVREADGLAMSSRNAYLTKEQRQAAPLLYGSLCAAEEKIKKGERNAHIIVRDITSTLSREPLAEIDYVAVVDTEELKPVDTISGRILVALAVRIGKTRLIDNIIAEVN